MKQLSQSRNNAQWWMCLVVKIKLNATKKNIVKESGMLGKSDMVKQEIARVNIHILGIGEVEWTKLL